MRASSSANPAANTARRSLRPARAAAAGGVTSLIMMPDTDPVIDDVALVEFVHEDARATTAIVNVYPAAALTKGCTARK